MMPMGRLRRFRASALLALCAIPLLLTPRAASAQPQPTSPVLRLGSSNLAQGEARPAPTPASIEAGRALFVGKRPFTNGGPPCVACHSVATLSFPYGGTVGPDLTHVAAKLGPQGLDYALQTLYFPTMTALFRTRPLTQDEQVDLGAFLQYVNESTAGGTATLELGIAPLAGVIVLLVITALAGRGRVHSVRRRRLARPRGAM
jgi:hypothetical protein